MTDTTNELPPDPCPGPPEAPYLDADRWLHDWKPVTAYGQPGEMLGSISDDARVVEVCPVCRRWRMVTYTRHSPPESAGSIPGDDPYSGG